MYDFDRLRVAKNCPASWNRMIGDDKVRHCTLCNRNVYNFTNMTRDEVQQVVDAHQRKLCARFYLRHDGTIMTKDCGLAVRRRVKLTVWAASFLALFGLSTMGTTTYAGAVADPEWDLRSKVRALEWVDRMLAESTDPQEIKELKQLRETEEDQLFDAVRTYLQRSGKYRPVR